MEEGAEAGIEYLISLLYHIDVSCSSIRNLLVYCTALVHVQELFANNEKQQQTTTANIIFPIT